MDKQKAVGPYNGMSFSLEEEVLTQATTRMDLKDIMLSETSQS